MACRIDEDQESQILAVFRMMLVRDPDKFWRMESIDSDTGRSEWIGGVIEYPNGPKWPKRVDENDRAAGRKLVHMMQQAAQYDEALPTLLRWQMPRLRELASKTSVRKRQHDVRLAACLAVMVRGASEGKTKILMSWDSMQKAIEIGTGATCSPATIKNIITWFESDEMPFTVTAKGKRGNLGRSTEIAVGDLDWTGHEWRDSLDAPEKVLTASWLAENADLLGEVYADEAERKRTLPERKADLSDKYGWHVDMDQFVKTNAVRTGPRSYAINFPGDTQPLPEPWVSKKIKKKRRNPHWVRTPTSVSPPLLEITYPVLSEEQKTQEKKEMAWLEDLLAGTSPAPRRPAEPDPVIDTTEETEQARIARLFPSLAAQVATPVHRDLVLPAWKSLARREREERHAWLREDSDPGHRTRELIF